MTTTRQFQSVGIFVGALAISAVFKGFDVALENQAIPHFSLLPLCLASVAWVCWYLGKRWALLAAFLIAIGWVIIGNGARGETASVLDMVRGLYLIMFATFFILLSAFVAQIVEAVHLARAKSWKDEVTDVMNARHYFSMAAMEIARAKRYHRAFTVAFFSINQFGELQKKAGVDMTNAMLKRIAEVLQKNLRNVDIVGRTADEEFSIFLPETSQDGARIALPRVHQALVEALPNEGPSRFAVCAIACSQTDQSIEGLAATAHEAIAESRSAGKQDIVFRDIA